MTPSEPLKNPVLIVYHLGMKQGRSLLHSRRCPFRTPNSEFLIPVFRCLAVPLAVTVLCWVPARSCHSDAIIVTKAMTATTVVEVSIEESEILVELEIGVPDLLAFQNLLPDEIRTRMGLEPEPLAERLVRFFGEDFVIHAESGPPLPGRVTDIEPRRRVGVNRKRASGRTIQIGWWRTAFWKPPSLPPMPLPTSFCPRSSYDHTTYRIKRD